MFLKRIKATKIFESLEVMYISKFLKTVFVSMKK